MRAVTFQAVRQPSREFLARVSALAPENPFYTAAFVEAMHALGFEPYALSLNQGDLLLSACTAFMKSGRLNRRLEIISLPSLEDGETFWQGVQDFCRNFKVSVLEVHSFASANSSIKNLPGEMGRRKRCEYILDLNRSNLWDTLSSNHKRNVKSGMKAGLEVRCVTDQHSCQEHARLLNSSMDRRRRRGEAIAEEIQVKTYSAYLQSRAGELYQALYKGEVVSSILILKGDQGAYYQSAGTSPDGMSCGASHFLLYEIANVLRSQSIRTFNLGGADQSALGLQRFKAGFGCRRVDLEAAEFYLGSRVKKKLGTAMNLLSSDPKSIIHAVSSLEQYVVYTARPNDIAPPLPDCGLELKKLSDTELEGLSSANEFLKEHRERFRKLGFNDAYGVYYQGTLAHISWMITADHDRATQVRNVKLKEQEVEITHCVTLPEFRGLGIYPFAIRSLCQVANLAGTRRVYMITNINNINSQKGIEKAGLIRQGKIIRVNFPLFRKSIAYRGHRWAGKGSLPPSDAVHTPKSSKSN